MRYFIKIIGVLFITGGITGVLLWIKPETEKKEPEIMVRSVRVMTAKASDVTLMVKSQGTVKAKQTINLTPQVSGEIIYVSDRFVAGGEFRKGEVILKLDPRDYKFEIITARAAVNGAVQVLAREKEESSLAAQEWESLGQGKASDLTLRVPQLEAAQAKLDSAMANLEKAKLRLERSVIKAPFDGIISQKNVDFGQYMNVGNRVATYHSTDIMEVRLPLSSRDLKQFDLKGLRRGTSDINVTFRTQNQGEFLTWKAKIIRTEGLIDSASRILFVVAELKGDQLKSIKSGDQINIGQFVTASIEGKHLTNKFKIAREVLRQNDRVLVVDENNKLRTRLVRVLESNRDYVVIGDGLKTGDVICLSQLGIGVDGMVVKPKMTEARYNDASTAAGAAHE
jgi:RND family efflux transporter MFP subunit